ncbi:sigma factor [Amycolatopsis nigrescens]|uniref:sigma factor n=1 Tax=Amycolatopsis nigrescens TaxID=381445 RepID=UPI00039A40A1|nr:sigma-70 family RNA polymerase sigma factor [Amycolatopsis nigrescens]
MTEQGTMPPPAVSGSDEQALLARLRGGEDAAFGELFELHAAAVRRLALGLANDRSEAEDITAETFFRVLQALRRGAGPRDHVRAYLLTVARRVSWEWHGARRDVPVTDDELTHRAGAGVDNPARSAEHTLITTAFTSLPERWRTVLWQTEVEGEQPAVVAPHFGLSANATAALARRARLGLRAAYLQAHLAVNRSSDVGCRSVMEKLGGYTAGSVTGSEARKIRAHLLGCADCRAMHAELRDVCSSLRAHAGVLVLLVPAAASLLGTASSAGSAGAGTGMAATLKGLLIGSKVKVGVALASTAAMGAFGIAVGPIVIDPEHTHQVSLPGQERVELPVALPPKPRPLPPTSSPISPDQTVIRLPGPAPRGPAEQGQQPGRVQPAGAAVLPTEFGGQPVPGSGQSAEQPGTDPRLDPPETPPEEPAESSAMESSPRIDPEPTEETSPDCTTPARTSEPTTLPGDTSTRTLTDSSNAEAGAGSGAEAGSAAADGTGASTGESEQSGSSG